MENLRRQQQEMQEAHERQMQEIQRQAAAQAAQQQANRPLCTHAVTNPMTGQTTYVTQPCAY
jgi:hypothetical protein